MPAGPGLTPPSTTIGPTTAFSGTLTPLGTGSGTGAGAGSGGRSAGGRAGAGALGAGGRAGLGGVGAGGAGGAAGAAGRGGAGGMGAGGAAGRGQGQNGEDDMEHEDKYFVDNDEIWDDLGLPKVAPPVFGE